MFLSGRRGGDTRTTERQNGIQRSRGSWGRGEEFKGNLNLKLSKVENRRTEGLGPQSDNSERVDR